MTDGSKPIMRLRHGFAGASALVLALTLATPEVWAERDTDSPSRVKSSGSIFEYFKRKREERRTALQRYREPGPRIQNAPGIDADKPEPPLVYQPEKLEALRADSITEPEPADPLAQAVYRELQDQNAAPRVTREEKTAIIDL